MSMGIGSPNWLYFDLVSHDTAFAILCARILSSNLIRQIGQRSRCCYREFDVFK